MLDLDRLELGELCTALEDNSPEHDWWLDPRTGELEPWSQLGDNEQETHPELFHNMLVELGLLAATVVALAGAIWILRYSAHKFVKSQPVESD